MERQRPKGGYLQLQKGQHRDTIPQRIKNAFTPRRAGGLAIRSAEGARFSYTEKALPKPPIDKRGTEGIVPDGTNLTRIEVPEELAGTTACFEATSADGEPVGRVWVHLEQPVNSHE